MVNFIIQWGPTLLVVINLMFAILFGLWRGFRKNLILAIQALIIFLICIGVFFYFVNIPDLDTFMYGIINSSVSPLLGTSLNSTLGVSESVNSIREAVLEIVLKNAANDGLGSSIQLIFQDNGAYLAAIVNGAYRLVFALLLSIVYIILLFIFYIIYLIAYPERRHKKKVVNAYALADSKRPYKKRRILGAFVGSIRGIVASVIGLSFLGTLLFIVSGGNEDTQDIDFGNNQINEAYGLYNNVSDYDDYGVFKILSGVKDSNQVPYYLYIADSVLSGSATITNLDGDNVTASYVLRDELGSYTKFAKKTLNLILKYGGDDLKNAIFTNSPDNSTMNELTSMFANEDFQKEFNDIIMDFDNNSFILNFALSAVDSLASAYDSFLTVEDERLKGLLDVIFKGENKIKVSQILTKEDAIALLNSVVKVLGSASFGTTEDGSIGSDLKFDMDTILLSAEEFVNTLTNLAILNENDRKSNFNRLFSDIFDYVTTTYVSTVEPDDEINEVSSYAKLSCELSNIVIDDVDWAEELKGLIKIIPSGITLYNAIDLTDVNTIIDSIFNLFETDNSDSTKNEAAYDNVVDILSNSQIIGVVLSLDPVFDTIFGSIEEQTGKVVFPEISFANKLDSDGNVIEYGETYTLLKALKILIKNDGKVLYQLFLDLASESEDKMPLSQILTETIDLLVKPVDNKCLVDYIAESKLIASILSSVLSGFTFDFNEQSLGLYLSAGTYIEVVGTDGETYKIIKASEFAGIIRSLKPVIVAFSDIIDNGFENFDITTLLEKERINTLLGVFRESQMLEGTVANVFITVLTSFDGVVLPKEYSSPEGWMTKRLGYEEYEDGELIKMLSLLNNMEVDYQLLFAGDMQYILTDFLTESNIDLIVDSNILYLSISGMIQGFNYEDEEGNDLFSIIIPTSTLVETEFTDQEDNIISALSKENLKDLVSSVLNLISFEGDIINLKYSEIFSKDSNGNYKILDSDVLYATITYALISNLDAISFGEGNEYEGEPIISIPDYLKNAGTKDELRENTLYDKEFSNNPWKKEQELNKLLDAVDILLNISNNPDFDFTGDLTSVLIENITKLNNPISSENQTTKLELVYNSAVIKSTFTYSLPKLVDMIVIPEDAIVDNYVTLVELQYLFNLIDSIVGDNGSFENINIDSLVITPDMKDDFVSSSILAATITKMMTEDENLKELIVIPNTAVEYGHISLDEMNNLYNSLMILLGDSDGNLSFSSMSDISVNTLLDLSNEQIDLLIQSVVINYSITKILTNTEMSGLSIVIPLESYQISTEPVYDLNNNEINTISQTELRSLLESIEIILDDSLEGNTVNVKNIFINREELLQNYILYATIINYMVNLFGNAEGSEGIEASLVTIPSHLALAGLKEELSKGLLTNTWYQANELPSLLNSLDLLLEISDSPDFNFDNTDELTTKLLNNLFTINEPFDVNQSKLDYIYLSEIIRATITSSLPKYAQMIVVPDDAKDENRADGYVLKSELKTLFELLSSIRSENQALEDISATDIKLNEETKNIIIESNILLATFTKYLKENQNSQVIVPLTAIDSLYEHIKANEMNYLLSGMIDLFSTNDNPDVSFESIEFKYSMFRTLSDEEIHELTQSSILSYTITSFLTSQNDVINIIVPASELEEPVLNIIDNTLVRTIHSSSIASIIRTTSEIIPENEADGISISHVFANKDRIIGNDILHATIINYMVTQFETVEALNVPALLKAHAEKDYLISNFNEDNEWIKTKELSNLFDSLDVLFNISGNSSFDFANIDFTTAFNGMNQTVDTTGQTKLELCYSSLIVKSTFVSTLSSNNINIPGAAYDNQGYVFVEELSTLFDVIDEITSGAGLGQISSNLGSLNVDEIIRIIDGSNNATIIRTLLSDNILSSLEETDSSINDVLDCYDSLINISQYGNDTDFNVLTISEIKNIVSGLKAILDIKDDLFVNSIDLSNISLSQDVLLVAYESRTLQRIITSSLCSSVGERNILVSCYNNVDLNDNNISSTDARYNKYLKIEEITSLFDAILTVTGSDKLNVSTPIDISSFEINIAKVDILLESNIAYILVSNQIVLVFDTPQIVFDESITKPDETHPISKTEIRNLVSSMLIILGNVESISFTRELSVSDGSITSSNINDITNSYIVWSLVTSSIDRSINGIPGEAYDEIYKEFISKNELVLLIEILGEKVNDGYSLSLESSFSFSTFDQGKIDKMSNSYIVRNKVSQILIDQNTLYVPASVVIESAGYIYIDKIEFIAFLNSIISFTNGSLNSINISLPSEENTDIVLSSIIMRTTISNSIKIQNVNTYYLRDQVKIIDRYSDNSSIIIVDNDELKNMLTGIRNIVKDNSLEFNLDIQSILLMNDSTIDAVLSANALRIAVSDLIENYLNIIPFGNTILSNYTKVTEDIVYIYENNPVEDRKESYSKADIILIIERIKLL